MSKSAKKNKFHKNWLQSHIHDPYVKKAQGEGYRARAAYKLQQMDDELGILRPKSVIVDLGACPGSWSQYVRKKLYNPDTKTLDACVVAIDLLPMVPIEGIHFMQGDFRDEEAYQAFVSLLAQHQFKTKVDVVLSDMAPNLSGVAAVDAAQMSHIAELVLEFALAHIHPQGWVVLKLFHGSGYSQVVSLYKQHFARVMAKKPAASRAESAETFLVAHGLKK